MSTETERSTLSVSLLVEATLELRVTETIDKAEYDAWLGMVTDTPERRSQFVTSHRDFDADVYAQRTTWRDWECEQVQVLDRQAREVTR